LNNIQYCYESLYS